MKKFFTSAALFVACIIQALAQQNCSNPLPVTLCPATVLNGQTNAGMLNDFVNPCNLSGEDLVYSFTTAPGTTNIYICYAAVSATMRAYFTSNCNATVSCGFNVINTSATLTYTVTGNTTYFLWIDAGGPVTYNISFGNDTTSTFVNIPNTQGNLGFENTVCAVPPFKASKPFLQVSYNGSFKTDPMTLSPLNVPGTLCIATHFRNTTGIEGIKRFEFYYNVLGYSNFTPSPMSFPGFYNAGTWNASWVGNKWVFIFTDLAGSGKGDFTGAPNICLRYEFCFNITPISNDPVKTLVLDSAFSDGFGLGFTGIVRSGCCPGCFTNCLGGPGAFASAGAHGFGTSVGDPAGNGLPIVLLQFSAKPKHKTVEVNWITASEFNNDYFTIEKSQDGNEWITAHEANGAGNSTTPISYSYTDLDPFPRTSYYRLKQTDFDGTTTYSDPASVNLKNIVQPIVFPNPTQGEVVVSGIDLLSDIESVPDLKFRLSNLMGNTFTIPYSQINGDIQFDISSFAKGIYLLEVDQDGMISHHRIVLQN